MFGYVLPVKPEMKVRDFESYRAFYCGLCKQLGNRYGLFSRFFLNYDLVLVAVMADALSGEEGRVSCEGCFANPFARRPTRHGTAGLSLACDGLMMLCWHKLRDNLSDEKWPKRCLYRLGRPFMRRLYKKAAKRQPAVAGAIERQMERQNLLEAAGCACVDEACEPTALMCSAIFGAAAQDDSQKRVLSRLGLFAGQIVYLLDAAEDYDDDAAGGRYNVFSLAGMSRDDAAAAARQRCNMAAGEIALCYNLLQTKQYQNILDNIFYLGLPQGIAMAGVKCAKRRAKHGQIESV
jgi:hypothetical protein